MATLKGTTVDSAGSVDAIITEDGIDRNSASNLTYNIQNSGAGAMELQVDGNKVWHAGNDGASSGLDADLLDGLSAATANTASTIVSRDANARFQAADPSAAQDVATKNYVDGIGNPAAGPAIILLASITPAGAATVDFDVTGYTGYKHLMFIVNGLQVNSDGAALWMRFSIDGGTTFRATAGDYEWSGLATAGATSAAEGSTSDTEIQITGSGSGVDTTAAASSLYSEIKVFDFASTTRNKYVSYHSAFANTSGGLRNFVGAGVYDATTDDITDVRFVFSAGTAINTGSVEVYGIKW